MSIEIDANVGIALNNLSSFYGENTAANRQSLRDDIEVRCVEVHKELLSKYSEIQKVSFSIIFDNEKNKLVVVELIFFC